MGLEIIFTAAGDRDFIGLIGLLDRELQKRYGDLQKQYDRHNQTDAIVGAAVVYRDEAPIACGAYKQFDDVTAEIKRVFVRSECRGQGIAKRLMSALEESAKSGGYQYAVLETGVLQPEAVGLYRSIGYTITDNYGPYAGNANSVCMKKRL